MALSFRIPKFTDRELISALGRIRDTVKPQLQLKIVANVQHQGPVELPESKPEDFAGFNYVLEKHSHLVNRFQLLDQRGREALVIDRQYEKISDTVTITDGWLDNFNDASRRGQFHVTILSSARTELRASDIEATLKGYGDDPWSRYRDAQTEVLNSLQQATESLIVKAAEKNAELDKARAERFEKLEVTLRDQLEHERKTLQSEFEKKQEQLEARQKAIADREASFNTKEARYVARKKQEEQIDQVKNWLSDWRLTSGTTAKRLPIFWAYISALVITGGLTAYATYHNYQLLKSADDIAKLAWWNWVAITTKSFFPLAAFTTFMVYFIRWSGSWARQHADEEFRNRTRLIDIGRSGWLLEAVRDAQEKGNEIPVDLLKELSRNLFSNAGSNEGDIHPQAVSDLFLQGLSSVRVKSADGSEVEATRNGKKK